MKVVTAQPEDFAPWLILAAEVETLFGPLVGNPDFQQALTKNFNRGTAFCVRQNDGLPGSLLLGGLLFSPAKPGSAALIVYTIGWLAVSRQCRRQGIGKLLVEHIIPQVQPPAELVVTTFSPSDPGGQPARQFYRKLGFEPAEIVFHDYRGQSEPFQVYRRKVKTG